MCPGQDSSTHHDGQVEDSDLNKLRTDMLKSQELAAMIRNSIDSLDSNAAVAESNNEPDNRSDPLIINPDDFPGIEHSGLGDTEDGEKLPDDATIDVGLAVRRARFDLGSYPWLFKKVVEVIAAITKGGTTVPWARNETISGFECAIRKTHNQVDVTFPLTRAEMEQLGQCGQPRGTEEFESGYGDLEREFGEFGNMISRDSDTRIEDFKNGSLRAMYIRNEHINEANDIVRSDEAMIRIIHSILGDIIHQYHTTDLGSVSAPVTAADSEN
ncbi:hypothetical protein QBC40DRAFT_296429 [Triangularia verruculosa]|uniref:Uncharacterized protein n=1 Tax=Triangularia verruculosa TaxID=2587418 RepID=A0AAN7ATI8_9PEZI|nr:hypothetical protein QBC40DRAFT_296429 [Triangularia verruculosa]